MGFVRRALIGTGIVAGILASGVVALGVASSMEDDERSCPGPDLPVAAAGRALPPAATQGQLLVAHTWTGDATIVDLATGRTTYVDVGLTEPHEVAVSYDGRWGVMSEYGDHDPEGRGFTGRRLAVIDMRARRLARVVDLGESRGAHGVAFVPGDARRVLVTTQSTRQVLEVDVERGTVVARMDSRADGSHLVAVTRDGRFAFTANEGDGSVTRYDLAGRTTAANFPVAQARAEGIAVTPDGREVWAGGTNPGVVYQVDAASGEKRDSITGGFVVTDRIAIPGDGSRALVMDAGCVHVIDVASRRRVGTLNHMGGSFGTSPDGRVAFLPTKAFHVVVVDVERREEVARHRIRWRPHGIAWGPTP